MRPRGRAATTARYGESRTAIPMGETGHGEATNQFRRLYLWQSWRTLKDSSLGPTGEVSLEFRWPAGLPSGFSTYHQMWVIDPAGSAGFAASNALKGTAP